MKLNLRSLLQLHIYFGLFCLPYLFIFGISSLDFNHRFLPDKPIYPDKQWQSTLSFPHTEELEEASKIIKEELNIFGWFLPWDSFRDSTKVQIAISQPAKYYKIVIQKDGTTQINEKYESLAHIFKMMHILGEDIPHAPWWVNSWKHYQRLTVYAMIFWIVSGIYLWFRKRRKPKLEGQLLWIFSILSILFILLTWLRK